VEYPAAVRREPVIVPEPRWLALGSTETVVRWASFTGDGTDGEPQSTELGHRNRYASTLEEFDASDCRFFELDVRGDDPAVTVADDQSSAVRLLSARGRAARARQREREQQREEEAKQARRASHEPSSTMRAPSRVSKTSCRSGQLPGCHSKRARSKYCTTIPSSTNSSLSG
jgi:hypothetical protein